MNATVQTVQQEHEQFLPYLDSIRETADSIGSVPRGTVLARTGEIHEFLAHRLLPHAVAEGRLMLPSVRDATGASETALGLNQCHIQLGRLTDDLEAVRGRMGRGENVGVESELRRVLYGIHALLVAHFDQADEAFTNALANLTTEERSRRFDEVEATAASIGELFE